MICHFVCIDLGKNMTEPFESKDIWWLLEKSEERVHGTLHFDPREGITVDFLGRFLRENKEDDLFWQPEIVLGNWSTMEIEEARRDDVPIP